MDYIDTWAQLIAPVTADRVGTPTIKPLVRRYVTDFLSRELNLTRQNGAASHPPGKHDTPSDRMVFRDFELGTIELIGSP